MTVEERLVVFKTDLLILDDAEIIQRHVLHGECHLLNEAKYFELKRELASAFGIHPNDVYMVGSGKLGFSIAPNKAYKQFGNESDIDLAVVSQTMFEDVWKKLLIYEGQAGTWEKEKVGSFRKYFFNGWIRPDMLPSSFGPAVDWFKKLEEITGSGKFGIFKINAGLYHSHFFLENYQKRSIDKLRTNS